MRPQPKKTEEITAINVGFFLTFLTCLALFIARDIPGAFSPPIRLEDAEYMLSFYWRSETPSDIFRYYAGYVSVGPNLIGYIAGQLPGVLGIYLLHWLPLIMAAFSFSVIQLRNMPVLSMTQREKAIVCIGLAMIPFSNYALLTNTTYMLWSMLIISILLVVFWTPQPNYGSIPLFAFLAFASLSHPLFVLMAPVLCIRIFFSKSLFERIGFSCILALSVLYVVTLVEFEGSSEGLGTGFFKLLSDVLNMFFSRAVSEPLMSTSVRSKFIYRDLTVLTVVLGCIAIIGFGVLLIGLRHRISRMHFLQIALLFCLALLFTAASVGTGRANLEATWGHRYIYPSAFLVMLLLFWIGLQIFKFLPPRMAIFGTAAVVVWISAINVVDWRFYGSSRDDRETTFSVVAEAARLAQSGQTYCIQNDRDRWAIRLSEGWPDTVACKTVSRMERID